jgi:hypothetical protein
MSNLSLSIHVEFNYSDKRQRQGMTVDVELHKENPTDKDIEEAIAETVREHLDANA